MNEQKPPNGIEWTRAWGRPGYTWNPIGGCPHECQWEMPDGSTATCYAKEIAEGLASRSYPQGFGAHYWHPDRLDEPLKLQRPAGIFLDSMSDLLAARVPDEQIEAVMDIVWKARQHEFLLLTKNPVRLEQFERNGELLPRWNLWVGISMPPTFMFRKRLSEHQQRRMFARSLRALRETAVAVRWVSLEPLSFNVAPMLRFEPLDWIVIGAATNGRQTFQPRPEWVRAVLDEADARDIPVFFKGNLEWPEHREAFPKEPVKQMRLL